MATTTSSPASGPTAASGSGGPPAAPRRHRRPVEGIYYAFLLPALVLFTLQALVACFEAAPGALGARFLVRQFTDTRLRHAEVIGERNVARAYEVATSAFDAVGEPVRAQLFFIVRAGIPEELLR